MTETATDIINDIHQLELRCIRNKYDELQKKYNVLLTFVREVADMNIPGLDGHKILRKIGEST